MRCCFLLSSTVEPSLSCRCFKNQNFSHASKSNRYFLKFFSFGIPLRAKRGLNSCHQRRTDNMLNMLSTVHTMVVPSSTIQKSLAAGTHFDRGSGVQLQRHSRHHGQQQVPRQNDGYQLSQYATYGFFCTSRHNLPEQITMPRKICATLSSPIIMSPPVSSSLRKRSTIS